MWLQKEFLSSIMRRRLATDAAAARAVDAGECDGAAGASGSHHGRHLPRLAIIMSGSLRRSHSWSHWPLAAQHLVQPLAKDADVHTFLCIDTADPSPPEEARKGLRIARVLQAPSNTSADGVGNGMILTNDQSVQVQMVRMASCYRLARSHEAEHSNHRPFEWYVKSRPDLLWFGDVAPLWTYSHEHVAVRARSLHGGIGPSSRHGPLLLSLEYMSIVRMGCERNADCNRKNAPEPCIVPDDTFGIMPAQLSARYFLFERDNESATTATPQPPRGSTGCGPAQQTPPNSSSTPWGTIPWFTQWGDANACHSCHKIQRKFAGEFSFIMAWAKVPVPFMLRAFRARIDPGPDKSKNGTLCSLFGETCADLRSDKHHNMPLYC